MIENISLFCSHTFSENSSFSIQLSDELFNTLSNESIMRMTLDVKDDSMFLINGNKSYKCSINYEPANEHLVHTDISSSYYEIRSANKGSIIIKDPPTIAIREPTTVLDLKNDNRKRFSSQLFDTEPAAKRMTLDKNIKIETQVKSTDIIPPSSKNKASALEMLKKGKTVKEVAYLCDMSEAMVKELISPKSDVRQELFKETPKKMDHTISDSKHRLSVTQPPNNKISNSENKCQMTVDFDIKSLNKKIEFGNKTIVNDIACKIQIPHEYKNETDLNNNNYSVPKSNNKIKPPMKINKTPTKRPINEDTNKTLLSEISKHERQIFTEPNKKISILNPKKSDKKPSAIEDVRPQSRATNHHSTEPYSKTQHDTIVTAKALTEPKEVPTEFKYCIVNPKKVDFKPNKSPNRDLLSRDPDSEDFRQDALDTFNRYKKCQEFYCRYRDKMDELKTRALKSHRKEELEVLFNEYNQLMAEQKQTFFVHLDNEVTVLQEKLLEMSSILGVVIN